MLQVLGAILVFWLGIQWGSSEYQTELSYTNGPNDKICDWIPEPNENQWITIYKAPDGRTMQSTIIRGDDGCTSLTRWSHVDTNRDDYMSRAVQSYVKKMRKYTRSTTNPDSPTQPTSPQPPQQHQDGVASEEHE